MNVRKIAYRVLRKLEKDNRFPSGEVRDALSRMERRERAFFKELVWGVMRRQMYLDWLLDTYLKNPEIPPGIRVVLRMGAYQILFMDSVPTYAAVSESVKLVENRSFRGLVNAILRRIAEDGLKEPPEIHLRYSHPRWIYEELLKWGDIAEKVMEDHLKPLPTTLRVNALRTTREELKKRIEDMGIETFETPHSPLGLVVKYNGDFTTFFAVKEGLATVQGEPSQLVTPILDPKPGSAVLDMAAGLGGKTTHIAEHMKDEGRVVAVDPSIEKIERLLFHRDRLGLKSIETAVMDGRNAPDVFKEEFDYVLLDAPCTSLGTARKNPDVLLTTKPSDPERLQKLQIELLEAASKVLRKGGKLLYSTCTFTKVENTGVSERGEEFGLRPVDIREKLQVFGVDYVWDGRGALLLPDGNVLTEFYISLMEKV